MASKSKRNHHHLYVDDEQAKTEMEDDTKYADRVTIINLINKHFPNSYVSFQTLSIEDQNTIDTFIANLNNGLTNQYLTIAYCTDANSIKNDWLIHLDDDNTLNSDNSLDNTNRSIGIFDNNNNGNNNRLILIHFQSTSQLSNCERPSSRTIIRWVTDEEAIEHLRSLLKQSDNDVIDIYKQLERFADRPQVLKPIVNERTIFMNRLSEWIETITDFDDTIDRNKMMKHDIYDDLEYHKNGGEHRNVEHRLNQIAERIFQLKQRSNLLQQIESNYTQLFRDLPDGEPLRQSLIITIRMLDDESKQQYTLWQNGTNQVVEYDLNRPCIIMDDGESQLPRITFTKQMERFGAQAVRLRDYGFKVPEQIEQIERQVNVHIDHVRQLRSIIQFYCTVADRILLSQRPMLIDKAKTFTSMMESNQNLRWTDPIEKIDQWIGRLKQFMEKFMEEIEFLHEEHRSVRQSMLTIIDQSFDRWLDRIASVRSLMDNLNRKYTPNHTLSWRKHWDYQLYKIMEFNFNCLAIIPTSLTMSTTTTTTELDRLQRRLLFRDGRSSANIFTIELQFNSSGYLCFEPSLQSLKQTIIEQIGQFISFPTKFQAFVDWSLDRRLNPMTTTIDQQSSSSVIDSGYFTLNDSTTINTNTRTLFHNIYYRNYGKFPTIYAKISYIIDELISLRERFREWCAPYHLIRLIKLETYNQTTPNDDTKCFQCNTLEQYQHNLQQIKQLQSKFDHQYQSINEIQCQRSPFVVNLIPLKMFIKWLHTEMEQALIRLFRTQTMVEMDSIEKICHETIERMRHQTETIDQLIEYDHLVNEQLPKLRENLLIDSVSLKEKLHFYRQWERDSPYQQQQQQMEQSFATIEQTNQLLKEFESIYETRTDQLESYRESIHARSMEQLRSSTVEIDSFIQRWTELDDQLKRTSEVINDFQINCQSLKSIIDNDLKRACKYFQLPIPDCFERIDQISIEIGDLYDKFHILYEFEQGLSIYSEMEWIIARNKLPKIGQFITEWMEKNVQSSTKSSGDNQKMLLDHIEQWRRLLSILELCRGDFYQPLHWNQLLSIIELTDRSYEDVRLSDLATKREVLVRKRAEILDLNRRSFNDHSLRETLQELEQFSTTGKFSHLLYRIESESRDIVLIKDWSSAFTIISDCFLLIATIRNIDLNSESGTISEEYLQSYREWDRKLIQLEQLMQLLNSVQRKWISLEPIYHSSNETSSSSFFNDNTFQRNSNDFQDLMKTIHRQHQSLIIRLLSITNLEGRLKSLDTNFGQTQRKLRMFIEESRQRFPRFYFLADEDLLLILSGKVDLNQSALIKKLFVNTIGRLVYGTKNEMIIESIESVQGEMIHLKRMVKADNHNGPIGIESWLRQLDNEIHHTLKTLFNDSYSQIRSIYGDQQIWIDLPSQLLSLLAWIDFTDKVEDSIRKHTLIDLKYDYERIVTKLTSDSFLQSLNEAAASTTANKPEKLYKLKIKQIVLDVIHFINVIDSMDNVRDLNNWKWQSQLRFYMIDSSSKVEIRMGLATFNYTFEYLGSLGDSALVHTELTNKCFLTMAQAMDLGLGGNPYGPAGTGKTESVKALGHHFGRQVLVFNCDEAIDVKSMTRILVGLIKCGSWGCFDEFNRLQLDVLSVLSSQIQEIQNAIRSNSKYASIPEYGSVEIDPNSAIFITLNPAGKDYGGRNRIPDNLKSLFLPVSMTKPDSKEIVRFILLAEGFSENGSKTLGHKLTTWFELADGSMSKQRHYDWGLRAMKACLEAAGRKRAKMNISLSTNKNLEQMEQHLLIDTLRQQIKSKLTNQDVDKFNELLIAVFGNQLSSSSSSSSSPPPVSEQTNEHSQLQSLNESIQNAYQELNLIDNEDQINKLIQLYEQIETRFGVVLIGPTGSGKSTLLRLLQKMIETKDQIKINVIVINPKSLQPRNKLYGSIDDDTRQWNDGLFSLKARQLIDSETSIDLLSSSSNQNWIIFDGDIDPDWVEALNSVLDDNRVLTLASGERIDFDSTKTRILFETTNLRHASPATISRLGVVSIGTEYSDIAVEQFIQSYRQMNKLPESITNIVWKFLHTNQTNIVSNLSTARTLLKHLRYSLIEQTNEDVNRALERMTGNNHQTITNRSNINGLVWTPTMERCMQMLTPLINDHLCLIGPIWSGKSTLVHEYIMTQSATGFIIQINCTPSTESSNLINSLLESSTLIGNVLRPNSTSHDHHCIMVRHYELLQYDKWQSNSLVQLLIFIQRYNGFYHPNTFEWLSLEHYQLIITCTNRLLIDQRLRSMMHTIEIDRPTLSELSLILEAKASSKLLKWFPSRFINYLEMINQKQFRNADNIEQSNTTTYQQMLAQNPLKIGYDLLKKYCQYPETIIDESIIDYELNCMIQTYLMNEEYKFNSNISSNQFYISINGNGKYISITMEELDVQISKWYRTYCTENGLNATDSKHCLEQMDQTRSLIVELCSFMDDYGEMANGIETLMIVGNRGMGRSCFSRMIAHCFGYDRIWTPDSITSERHLINELKTLFNNNDQQQQQQQDVNDDNQNKMKILLLLDRSHFQIIQFLRDRLFTFLYSNEILSGRSTIIRVIITTEQLDPIDHLLWLRHSRLHRMKQLSTNDFDQITERIIKSSSTGEPSIIDKLYPIYCHFGSNTNVRMYRNYVTTFINILEWKMNRLEEEKGRLQSGVRQLDHVGSCVGTLRQQALEQKTQLDSKRSEADEAFQMIMSSMHQSEDKKVELEELQQRIGIETATLKERKSKIDSELESIEPILQTAKAAVGNIQSSSLAEIRSLRAPPDVIRDIMEGVLRLMGIKDTTWGSMKSFLSRKGINEIINFDCRSIKPDVLQTMEQLLESRSESFKSVNARRASIAAASLAEWVKANVDYARVLNKIDPLERELKRLETDLTRAQTRLKTLNLQLAGVDTEVESLRTRMQSITIEAAQIEIKLNNTSRTLEQSESLVNDLSSEHSRWSQKLNQIESDRLMLPIRSAIASAYLSIGCVHSSINERIELLNQCMAKYANAIDSSTFSPIDFMECISEESLFLNRLYAPIQPIPLICDPMRKAFDSFEANSYEQTRLTTKEWIKQLELSIRFGRTLIITDFALEQLDVRLLPLIFGSIHGTHDTRWWTFIGDRRIDYNPNFRLYLQSTDSNQHITNSELFRMINLMPSIGSTSERLLKQIIQINKPELEPKMERLESEIRSLRTQLISLENELLENLNSTNSSQILDNVELIEKLRFLKKSSEKIEESLKESNRLRKDLETERSQYELVAQFSATLFFSIDNLKQLCPMYYFGFDEFERIFRQTLVQIKNNPTKQQQQRQQQQQQQKIELNQINEMICYAFYRYVARALFAEHRQALWHYFLSNYPNEISSQTKTTLNSNEIESITEFLNDLMNQSDKSNNRSEICLIITSPGADPSHEIQSALMIDGNQFRMISMGNDVIEQVETLLTAWDSKKSTTKSKPNILCLANLHLVLNWLSRLAQIVSNQLSKQHYNLIILITESSEHFPTSLLQCCVKFAYESVPGIRAHLRRLKTIGDGLKPIDNTNRTIQSNSTCKTFEQTTGSAGLFTLLEYFHTICCERRFYQPFGWTKTYDFGFNEYRSARYLLQKLLDRKFINQYNDQSSSLSSSSSTKERQVLLFDTIIGLFRDVIYGGKIDFIIDDKILYLLLLRCFDPDEKFNLDRKVNELSTGIAGSTEFILLGLPANANSIRNRSIEENLKHNLQVLSSTTAIKTLDSKETEKSKFGREYFKKLWTKILAKCKIHLPSSLNECESIFIDDDEYMNQQNGNENVNYLHANEWNQFVRRFALAQINHAKKIMDTIHHDLYGDSTEKLDTTLTLNITPEQWSELWNDSPESAQDFLITLARIYIKLNTLQQAQSSSTTPTLIFDLTACFQPKLFLNSLKQFAARQLSVTVDQLTIAYIWNDGYSGTKRRTSLIPAAATATSSSDYGIMDESMIRAKVQPYSSAKIVYGIITGIGLEGATFVHDRIQQCEPDSPLVGLMPNLNMVYTIRTKKDNIDNNSRRNSNTFSSKSLANVASSLRIPLYSNSKRTTLLSDRFEVPCTSRTDDQWSEMGVALSLGNWIN